MLTLGGLYIPPGHIFGVKTGYPSFSKYIWTRYLTFCKPYFSSPSIFVHQGLRYCSISRWSSECRLSAISVISVLGDYTRLDETIMVLIAAKAERKGTAVGFRMMISPEGYAIVGLREISSSWTPPRAPSSAEGAFKTKWSLKSRHV